VGSATCGVVVEASIRLRRPRRMAQDSVVAFTPVECAPSMMMLCSPLGQKIRKFLGVQRMLRYISTDFLSEATA
jgi:hypothetical protein